MMRGLVWRGLAAALALWLVGLVGPGRGIAWADDPLAQARDAVAASDYPAARAALAAARDAGGHSPDETAEIYRLTGVVEAALGDARAATDAFTRWLAVQPKASLPPGTSPKIRRPFDAAAKYFASHSPLDVKIETRSSPPAITLVVVSDPLAMIAKARVVFVADGGPERMIERTTEAAAAPRTELTLPRARRIDARIVALDKTGNQLVEIGSKDVPVVIVSDAPPPVVAKPAPAAPAPPPVVAVHAAPSAPAPAAPPAWYRRWWPYAGAAVATGAAASLFALSAHNAANDLLAIERDASNHTLAEAKSVEDRGRRDTLYANLGLGVTAAFAATAGVMLLTAPRDHGELHVAAAPSPGGGSIVLGGAF